MFEMERDDRVIGEYLRSLIREKYKSDRQFCKAYLMLRDGSTDDEAIHKVQNRFSQIFKGIKRIQTTDLPYVTDLLSVSCEEILSAGKTHMPVSSHMTNYDIAFSKDRSVWDKYMKREDKIFLNCDEYGKTVLDYAIEFKNYDFIKYLMDEKYIWFVDLTKWRNWGLFGFGAGTSIKIGPYHSSGNSIPHEIQFQDRLRTDVIALAIENGDRQSLDTLLAREIPDLGSISIITNHFLDLPKDYNPRLIKAIARASEDMLDYFSSEFVITTNQKKEVTLLFPFISEVIECMLGDGRNDAAELFLRRSIKHNQFALNELKRVINEAIEFYSKKVGNDSWITIDEIKERTLYGFGFNDKCKVVSFSYNPEKHKYIGFATNIVKINRIKGTVLIKELIIQLNDLYDQIVTLGGVNQNA